MAVDSLGVNKASQTHVFSNLFQLTIEMQFSVAYQLLAIIIADNYGNNSA